MRIIRDSSGFAGGTPEPILVTHQWKPPRAAGPGDIIRRLMIRLSAVPRPLLRIAAILFAAATVLYSGLWMYYIRAQPRVVIGVEYEDPHGQDSLRLTQVIAGSGAEAAGLRPGDLLRAIDGLPLEAYAPFPETVTRGRPGDVVRGTIERPGEPGPRVVPLVLGPRL